MNGLRRSLIVILVAVAAVTIGSHLRSFVDSLNTPTASPTTTVDPAAPSPSQSPPGG
jgi:hypothetical protein